MCGIAGVFGPGLAAEPALLHGMLDGMAHRGPDGRAVWCDGDVGLGHLRLSILDPSTAGDQPMVRQHSWLVHNGEIYNYRELASDLRGLGYDFSTGTDTEVMLAAYDAWGLAAFERFNGMWAFALWDSRRRRLILSRDRAGVKPLYLRRSSTGTAFASEIGALLKARLGSGDDWLAKPDERAVRDFLGRGLVDHGRSTFVEGVERLPAGHHLIIEDGASRLVRYWAPPDLSDDDRPSVRGTDARRDVDAVDRFRELFDSSVTLRLRSDVPLGSCLSGGLDSSAIVATSSKVLGELLDRSNEQPQRFAFHARYPAEGVDESRFAATVADRAGVELRFAPASPVDLIDAVLPVLAAQGEPFPSTSILAQYRVMQAVHEAGLKVVLDGQGADELLGGYLPYVGDLAAGHIRSGRPDRAAREIRLMVANGVLGARPAMSGLVRGLLPATVREGLRIVDGRHGVRLGPGLSGVETLATVNRVGGTALGRRLWHDFSSDGLPALLRYEDRNSMAWGVESRVPFLDVRLIEHAVALPDRLRIGSGWTKLVLRRAMAGRLPDGIVWRKDKVGFATPQRQWVTSAISRIAATLRDGQVVRRGWVAATEVERLIAAPSGPTHELLWRVFILELWVDGMWPDRAQHVPLPRAA